MKTWRIRLVTVDGSPLSLKQAALRFVLALLGLLLVGVGFWWALFDRDRQFLHDRIAGTRLVRVPRKAWDVNCRDHLRARLLEIRPESVCALDAGRHRLAAEVLPNTPVRGLDPLPRSPCALALGDRRPERTGRRSKPST